MKVKSVEQLEALLPSTDLPYVVVSAGKLRLRKIMAIASQDTSQPALNVVLVRLSSKGLGLGASDGFHAVRVGVWDGDDEARALVPLSACVAIGRLSGRMRVSIGENVLVETAMEKLYITPYKTEEYPDLDAVFAKEFRGPRVEVDAVAFQRVVKAVQCGCSHVVCKAAGDLMVVHGLTGGGIVGEVEAKVEGSLSQMTFDSKLLLHGLALCGDRVVLTAGERAKDPVKIGVEDGEVLIMQIVSKRQDVTS